MNFAVVNLRKSLLSIVLAYSAGGKRCLQSCLVHYQRGEQFDEVLSAPRAVRLFTSPLLLQAITARLSFKFIISTSSFSAIAFSTPEEDLPEAVVIMFQSHFPQLSTSGTRPSSIVLHPRYFIVPTHFYQTKVLPHSHTVSLCSLP